MPSGCVGQVSGTTGVQGAVLVCGFSKAESDSEGCMLVTAATSIRLECWCVVSSMATSLLPKVQGPTRVPCLVSACLWSC
jgi:hypothetical protein